MINDLILKNGNTVSLKIVDLDDIQDLSDTQSKNISAGISGQDISSASLRANSQKMNFLAITVSTAINSVGGSLGVLGSGKT